MKIAKQRAEDPPREWGLAFVVFAVASTAILAVVVPLTLENVSRSSGFSNTVGVGIVLITGVIGVVAGLKAISTRDGLIGCAIGFSGFSLLYGCLGILRLFLM